MSLRSSSYGSRRRTGPSPRVLLVAGALLLIVALVAGALWVRHNRQVAAARSYAQAVSVVDGFLTDWSKGDWGAAAALTDAQLPAATGSGMDVAGLLRATHDGLVATSTTITHGPVTVHGPLRGASFHLAFVVQGLGDLAYDSRVNLIKVRHVGWRIAFTPATVHPHLHEGQRLVRVRTLGHRGQILAADGRVLRDADGELAGNLVGVVSPVDANQAKVLGPRFLAGDKAGTSGLERAFNNSLAGTPGGEVRIADAAGRVVEVLATYAMTDGVDLHTTIDLAVQRAGEQALAGLAKPGALVAIDVRTGAVTGIVNAPLGGFGRAVRGSYPPGSTFKMITATAALLAGRTPDSQVDCPKDVTVNGRTFVNAEASALGSISFRDAFVHSCNTAFVNIVKTIPTEVLVRAARLFGFTDQRDAPGPLPITSQGGYYPTPVSVDQAAGQGIGQDQDIVSPLQMASVAAGVAAGEWRQPYVTDPVPMTLIRHPLPASVFGPLRDFMAGVVTDGTAKDAGLPGGTYGKTGTAEFGPAKPYKTHAWFVGYRGTTAFAVIVEDGGFGGEVAAPLAARFLRLIGG